MILGAFAIVTTVVVAAWCLKLADKKSKGDIGLFAKVFILIFAGALMIGISTRTKAEPLTLYAGVEAGVDWPHELSDSSPHCVEGEHDALTSDGRLFFGLSQPIGIVTFYDEGDLWRHKSCALVADREVYNAYGVKFGVRANFHK